MLVSAVSVLVVAQSSSEIPEGLMNNPVYKYTITQSTVRVFMCIYRTELSISTTAFSGPVERILTSKKGRL